MLPAKDQLKITEPVEESRPTLKDIVQVRGVADKFKAAGKFFSGKVTVNKVVSDDLIHIDGYTFNVNQAFLESSRKEQLEEMLIEIFYDYGMSGNHYLSQVEVITEEAKITTPLSD